jgi:cysteinyl-tRNA synthetase
LKCFGIYEDGDFPTVTGAGESEGAVSKEDMIAPLMNALSKYRDQVKNAASDDPKALFRISDELRDDILPYLGIRLEDKGKGSASIWKYEKPDILIKERDAKIAEKAKKEAEKQAKKEQELKKKSTSGKDWFRVMESDAYSKFNDETGLPTHDINGKELSEAIVNGLKKKQKKQEDVYQKWLKEQQTTTTQEEEKVE